MNPVKRITIIGASGYIGGRLAPRLLERGYRLKCVSRSPENLSGKFWKDKVSIVKADVFTGEGLEDALEDCEAAFYLAHSMADVPDFEETEKISAENFASLCRKSGVKRVIYLGGLGEGKNLSRHLRSRQMVGEIFRSFSLNVTEFRAAIIVGSGSVSFEIIRYLVERLPIIPYYEYLLSLCQPIAVRDVLSYLVLSLEKKEAENRIIEIGGSGVLTYKEMLEIYAQVRGLRRKFFKYPIWSPRAFARFIDFLTPIPGVIALPLLESLKSDVVCKSNAALDIFPEVKPLDYITAVKYALIRISENAVETTWAMAVIPIQKKPYAFTDKEGMIAEERTVSVSASCGRVFKVISEIGGEKGWYYANWLWNLRALADALIGGIGMRRGRRHPFLLFQGEPLDFWRVERVIESRLILLRAEMKLPGRGWLEFEVSPSGNGRCFLRQTAYFEPKGFFGNLYWYGLYPVHMMIFAGLVKEIKRRSEVQNSFSGEAT